MKEVREEISEVVLKNRKKSMKLKVCSLKIKLIRLQPDSSIKRVPKEIKSDAKEEQFQPTSQKYKGF